MRFDIEGEVALPDVVWSCPACDRRRVEAPGERLKAALCGADYRTGRPHGLVTMIRTPNLADEIERLVELQPAPAPPRRIVELTAGAPLPSAPQGWCPSCGPLVEVDNPIRREIRHRRGCPDA